MTTVALVPARAGSKGFPGKNLAPLGGMSLLGHAIRLAQAAVSVDRVVVSTDSAEIADAARSLGADVPFLRPARLARDETPMLPVVQHALEQLAEPIDTIVLLSPTAPFRLPEDVDTACAQLQKEPKADGIVGVAAPWTNPLWVTVYDDAGWMRLAFADNADITRRQDLPDVLQINGSLYVWRAAFIHTAGGHWTRGRHLVHRMPPWSAIDINEAWQLALADALLASGAVTLPWLTRSDAAPFELPDVAP